MKRLIPLTGLIISVFISTISGQVIPNGDFENWENRFLFNHPSGWLTQEDPGFADLTTFKSDDADDGDFSLRLESILEENAEWGNEIIFGYAIFGGLPGGNKAISNLPKAENGDDSQSDMPVPRPWNNTVDRINFSVKYDIQPDDAAIAWIMLTSSGEVAFDSTMVFTGQMNSWQLIEIDLDEAIDADGLLVIFTSSFPFGEEGEEEYKNKEAVNEFIPAAGSWIMADKIYFSFEGSAVPEHDLNGSFENWDDVEANMPVDWTSSNTWLANFDMENVTSSEDSYSGTKAARLETVLFDVYDEGNYVSGILSLGSSLWEDAGIPFTGEPDFLAGAYKYVANNDDAFLSYHFTKSGIDVGGSFIQFPVTGDYTEFITWQNYYHDVPDMLRIDIMSGQEPGSVLYIDDLKFLDGRNVQFEIKNENEDPVINAEIRIEGINPVILGNKPYISTDPGGMSSFLLPDGSYQFSIIADGYDDLINEPFVIDGDDVMITKTLAGGAPSDPDQFSITVTDGNADMVYFAGDDFEIEIYSPNLPEGITPVVSEGIFSGPEDFNDIAVLDNMIVSSISGGVFSVSGTVKEGLIQGVIGLDFSLGMFTSGPFPVHSADYVQESGSDMGLAIVGVGLPGGIASDPELSALENLYNTEQDISFLRDGHGSIQFGPGLNIIDNRHNLGNLEHGLKVVSNPESQIYYVEIDPDALEFLSEREATITIEGFELSSFTIRKTEFGLEADYEAPEDVTANTTAVLTDNILTFYVDGFSRYTVMGEQTFELVLIADPENSGTVTGAGEYPADELIMLGAEANTGFEFLNWRKDGAQISEQPDHDFTMPSENVTLVAHFVEEGTDVWELVLDVLPAGAGTVTGAGKYTEGDQVAPSATAAPGFVFTGWTDSHGDPVELEEGIYTMPASDITLTANFREFVNASIDPDYIEFKDFEDTEELVTTVTWNDASSINRIYMLLGDEEIDFSYDVTDIDGLTATLTMYPPAKGVKGLKSGTYTINGFVEFDSGDPAQFAVGFTDPTWWGRIVIYDKDSGSEIPNASVYFRELDSLMYTDHEGRVDFNLPAGSYTLDVSAFAYQSIEAFPITVEEIFDGNRFSIEMERDFQVYVTVTGTDPEDGADDVPLDTEIVITFERDIQEGITGFGFGEIFFRDQFDNHLDISPEIRNGNTLVILIDMMLSLDNSYTLYIPYHSVLDAENPDITLESDLLLNFSTGEYIEPEIQPETVEFSPDDPSDVEFVIAWGSETEVVRVFYTYYDDINDVYQEIELVKDTDYLLEDNLLTILADFILSLEPEVFDWLGFSVEFGSGWEEWFGIEIMPDMSPSLQPAAIEYDLTNPVDLFTSIVSHEEISSIKLNQTQLVTGEDYYIEGLWLFIKNSFLSSQLNEAGEEIVLTAEFETGDVSSLTITAVESNISNAVIDPGSATMYGSNMPEYIDIEITWNDASDVDSIVVLLNYGYIIEQIKWDQYEVIDDDGTTATLRVFLDEPDGDNGGKYVLQFNSGLKSTEYYTYVNFMVAFDTGSPAWFFLTVIDASFDVIVALEPENGGWVTGDWDYDPGDEVVLEATAAEGYLFHSWRKDGAIISTDNPYIFDMPEEDVHLTAYFVTEGTETYTLTLGVDPEDAGTVSGAGDYEEGAEITLSATANAGYLFVEWTDEQDNTVVLADGKFIMPANDVTLTANFDPVMYTVTFTVEGQDNAPVPDADISVIQNGTVILSISTDQGGKAEAELTAGDYNYLVTIEDYEEGSGEFTVTDQDIEITVSLIYVGLINNIPVIDRISVYPNPSNGLLYVEYFAETGSSILLEVISITGKPVFQKELHNLTTTKETIDLRNVSKGVYFLRVSEDGIARTVKVVFR
jgi:hypothetical protein